MHQMGIPLRFMPAGDESRSLSEDEIKKEVAMPISEMRVHNFRAFADSGVVTIGGVTPVVGRNDVGKSGLLHALRLFFEPPKRGGLD